MAKTNKTEFALLGILIIEPMSGYDLKSYIQQSIGYFWQESYGQIYPALRRLSERKLVTKRKAKNSRGPERYVYSITAAGRKAFKHWLATEPEPETIRHELLLKLFFGTMGEREDHARNIQNLLAGQRRRLAMFEQIEKQLPQYKAAWLTLLQNVVPFSRVNRALSFTAAALEHITHEVLYIWGSSDPFGSLDVARRADQATPNSKLQQIGVGHLPWMDDPRACSAATMEFLR